MSVSPHMKTVAVAAKAAGLIKLPQSLNGHRTY